MLVGINIGALVPLSKVILAEITPVMYRGRLVTLMGAAFAMGELVAAWVAWVFLDSLDEGNWRGAVFWLCLPALISVSYLYYKLDECARYQYLNHQEDDGWAILNTMAEDNLRPEQRGFLTEDTRTALLTWAVVTREIVMKTEKASMLDLFNKKYRSITSILWVDWFSNIFIYYGIIFMIPLTLY